MLQNFPIKDLSSFPPSLNEIPQPPKKLRVRGTLPPENFVYLAVVGSRKYSPYGREACQKLIEGLRGYPVAIVSGLALGIDSIAHESALAAGLPTVAVPGSGLDEKILYPQTNIGLAKRILENGGAIISEFEDSFRATSWSFPQRNRIMAGLSPATLVVEASLKSGTLITSRLALEYGKEVLAVPGNIFSSGSEGTFHLIRNGATPVRESIHILDALGIQSTEKRTVALDDLSPEELKIVELLTDEPCEKNFICESLEMHPAKLAEVVTILELRGVVKESLGKLMLA